MPGYALSVCVRRQSPALGELIPELDAVRLSRVHEDMRSGFAHIVSAPALHTYLAQIRSALRTSTKRHRNRQKEQYIQFYAYAHTYSKYKIGCKGTTKIAHMQILE
jgi:hypothetical protein